MVSVYGYQKKDSIINTSCILKVGNELIKQSDGFISFEGKEVYFSYEAGSLKINDTDYKILDSIDNEKYLDVSIKIYKSNFVEYDMYSFHLKKDNLLQRYLIIEIFKCKKDKKGYKVYISSPLFYDLKPSKIYKNGTINCG